MTLYGEGSSASSTENELWSSEGSGMLIGDPLGEGSNASSTDSKLWREYRCPEGSGKLMDDPLW